MSNPRGAPTHYAAGPRRVAYRATGTGPALVVTPGWVTHLDVDAETTEIRAF